MNTIKLSIFISVICFVLFTIYRYFVPAVNINDALSEAIEAHNLQAMEDLLKQGANPDLPANRLGDRRELTKQIISFYTGSYSIVESGNGGYSILNDVNEDEMRLLVQYGDINKPLQHSHKTPLMEAIMLDRVENARLMLKYGANYSATYQGKSLLDYAMSDKMTQLLAPYKQKLKEGKR